MILRPILFRLFAFTILLALASMPFGGAVAMSAGAPVMAEMPGMSPGEVADEMPCCPNDVPKPSTGCDKSACPTMATCAQQCVPAAASADAGIFVAPVRQDLGRPTVSAVLASLGPEPPPRPPKN
ncbi:hypothetical protein Sa4125_18320 [Aureimonas sp. SA4125]|nr:hypothetical protein Sa4125_18320 [Aureimonas sp. SA4125]